MSDNNYIDIENKEETYWNLAIGLQEVDNLKPSKYMSVLYKKNINGEITLEKLANDLKVYYEDSEKKFINNSEYECDFVALCIVELLEKDDFELSLSYLKYVHKYLFQDVYDFFGQFRLNDIIKYEEILNKDTVSYGDYLYLEDSINYDLENERLKHYERESMGYLIDNIMRFNSSIWQIHPFKEGNTRTIAIFIQKYLVSLGYRVNNDLYEKNSKFYRNALVRSAYYNNYLNIDGEYKFLRDFYENLLLGKKNNLNSNKLIIKELFE